MSRLVLTFFLVAILRLVPSLTSDAAMPVTDFSQLLTPGEHQASMSSGAFTRRFIFITPRSIRPGDKLPLVFFFHGAGGTATQAARTYGWLEKAEAEKFFLVFPQGLGAWQPEAATSFLLNPPIWRDEHPRIEPRNVNDVEFFRQLLDGLEAALPVDHRRVYVTGFSNGAGMAFTLGGHFSDRIAAIAPVASQSLAPVESLARPLPVFYLVGTADPLIPFHGGEAKLPWGAVRTTPPVQDSADHWARLDGCPPQPVVVSDAGGVRVVRYGPGRDGAELLYTVVTGNGHHYPGTLEPLPKAISGPTLDPFHATDWIWEFFAKHPLPGG